ncbi:hypothetical protein Pla52nx_000060 [Stieleria varia]|uniref:hypothetical protein n=1 Tax=Stieleria varia TaxID=2528005 RepID=UPI0011B4A28E
MKSIEFVFALPHFFSLVTQVLFRAAPSVEFVSAEETTVGYLHSPTEIPHGQRIAFGDSRAVGAVNVLLLMVAASCCSEPGQARRKQGMNLA